MHYEMGKYHNGQRKGKKERNKLINKGKILVSEVTQLDLKYF